MCSYPVSKRIFGQRVGQLFVLYKVLQVVADFFCGTDGVVRDGADVEILIFIIADIGVSKWDGPLRPTTFLDAAHLLHSKHQLFISHSDWNVSPSVEELTDEAGMNIDRPR